MKKGFTLIEILIVIGIIAVLAAGIIIALNPGRQFARTRNTQRVAHLNDILKAIVQNMTENGGRFACGTPIPTSAPTNMSSNPGDYNIAPCLVPTYTPRLPVDPSGGNCHWASTTDYNTCYRIQQDSATGRITLDAPNAELGETIQISQ